MTTCDNPTCTGHLGKFSDCITEALHSMEAARTTGSVEFRGHLSLFRFTEAERSTVWVISPDVMIPAGTYLMIENDQGFVDSGFWADVDGVTDDEPNERFEAADAEYSAWLEASDV